MPSGSAVRAFDRGGQCVLAAARARRGRFDLNISGLDTVKLDECIKSGKMADEISKDVQDANSYGVTGTPTFFINGYRLVGAQPLASFSSIIDQLLAAK